MWWLSLPVVSAPLYRHVDQQALLSAVWHWHYVHTVWPPTPQLQLMYIRTWPMTWQAGWPRRQYNCWQVCPNNFMQRVFMATGTLALTGISCCITMLIMRACRSVHGPCFGLFQQACWSRLEQVAILLCPLT